MTTGETMDFTIRRDPIKFRIDDDVFHAPPLISPITLKRLAALHARMGDAAADMTNVDALLTLFSEVFATIMPGPDGVRFVERLNSETEPIDLTKQALPVFYWLLERYGLRPTAPSSPSPDGSTDGQTESPSDGTSSTDGASAEDSAT